MAITLNINITADTEDKFTDLERAVISQLLGERAPAAAAEETAAPEKKPATAKRAPRKAAAATKEEPKTLQEELAEDAPASDATDDSESEDEDLLGGETEAAPEYTVQDAVKKASGMVAAGGSADVKAALAKAGAKKVSELKGDKIAAFMAALEG